MNKLVYLNISILETSIKILTSSFECLFTVFNDVYYFCEIVVVLSIVLSWIS